MQKPWLILIFLYACALDVFAEKWIPKIIWTYWEQPITQKQFLNVFHYNHVLYTQGWQLRLLNKYSAEQYMRKIPYYKGDFNELPHFKLAHKSDFVRLILLSYFGGVYLDYSCILNQHIDWLALQQLIKNPDVQNRYGQSPEVLLFTNYDYELQDIFYDSKTNKNYTMFPGYELWFLAAVPNAQFIVRLYQQLHTGLQNKMYNFKENGLHYADKLIIENNIKIKGLSHYLASLKLVQYIIQQKQRQLDTSPQNSTEKLAVWYYKIWHISSIKGPSSIYQNFHTKQFDMLAYTNKTDLENHGIEFQYFVKLFKNDRQKLEGMGHLKKQISSNGVVVSKNLSELPDFQKLKYFCPQSFKLRKGSYIYQFLYVLFPEYFDVGISVGIEFIELCDPLIQYIHTNIKYQSYYAEYYDEEETKKRQQIKRQREVPLEKIENERILFLQEENQKLKTVVGQNVEEIINLKTENKMMSELKTLNAQIATNNSELQAQIEEMKRKHLKYTQSNDVDQREKQEIQELKKSKQSIQALLSLSLIVIGLLLVLLCVSICLIMPKNLQNSQTSISPQLQQSQEPHQTHQSLESN